MDRIWLTGITCEGNKENLIELLEPIMKYFDGLIWTFHYPKDEGADYLESIKGEGEIIYSKWCNRFDFSRNTSLFQSPIKNGDWFVVVDDTERISQELASSLKSLCNQLNNSGINGVYLRGKHFMFRYNESTKFKLNPHCGVDGVTKSFEISSLPNWKDLFFTNVRSEQRDKFQFVKHNLKYYLYPETNHLVLKCEQDIEFIKERFSIRAVFLNDLMGLGLDPYDLEEVFQYIVSRDLSDISKDCINKEKYLNDVYRFYRMGLKDFEEDFDFNNLVEIK